MGNEALPAILARRFRLAVQNLQQMEHLFAHRFLAPLDPLSDKLWAHT
jgi:hypothetical protein